MRDFAHRRQKNGRIQAGVSREHRWVLLRLDCQFTALATARLQILNLASLRRGSLQSAVSLMWRGGGLLLCYLLF